MTWVGAAPPARPRRRGLIIGLLIGGLVVAVLVGGLILFGIDQALTHDLIDADFDRSADPFETGTSTASKAELVEGTYQLRVLENFEEADGPVMSFGGFARVAYAFDLGVDVVSLDGLDSGTATGIGCVEDGPGSTRDKESQFLFVIGASNSAILHVDPTATDAAWDQNVLAEGNDGIQPGDRIELRCETDVLHDDEVKLTASVNGQEVLTGTHDAGHRVEGFESMLLFFLATEPGQQVRFDNASAHVPE